jgi:hypothetical protein
MRLSPSLIVLCAGLALAGCNSTASNAPPPIANIEPESPLPAPPSNIPGAPIDQPTPDDASIPDTPAAPAPQAALAAVPGLEPVQNDGDCSGGNSRFRTLVKTDLSAGHTTKAVHDEIMGELAEIEGRCAQGENTNDDLVLLRQRFGYPST